MPVALAAVLEVGSRGGDVTAVQKKLIQWGYLSGAADGQDELPYLHRLK